MPINVYELVLNRNSARKNKFLDEKNKMYSSQEPGETAVNSVHTADSFNCENVTMKPTVK